MIRLPTHAWQPDLPDYRDYVLEDEHIQGMLRRLRRVRRKRRVPDRVDLREFLPPVRDQGPLRASAAFACVAMVEYFQRRAHGRLTELSERFVYKATRNLLQLPGNVPTDLRTTLKAIARFGVPPARYCPYDTAAFDQDPDPLLFAFGRETAGLRYVRLDSRNQSGRTTLERIRAFLAANLPCVLGFSLPASVTRDADIPWRPQDDSLYGGHAVLVTGYDDARVRSTKGALLFRNCWGETWGESGYGWLPYRFVVQQLASSVWVALTDDWLASGEFGRPLLQELRRRDGGAKP